MKNSNLIVTGIVAVLVALGIGFFVFPASNTTVVQGVSSPGVTGSTQRLYSITSAPATASATTSSILNTDGTDRGIVYGITDCTSVGTSKTYLTGAGLAAFTVQMSTSTTAGDAKRNTNYVFDLTIATSSAWEQQFTSSISNGAVGAGVWPTGTYLNITTNATNTSACTFGVGTVPL